MHIVTRVRKERSLSGSHEHLAGVQTVDGAFYTRLQVVQSLDRGEAWFAGRGTRHSAIRKVPTCLYPGCSLGPYFMTTQNRRAPDSLENLEAG